MPPRNWALTKVLGELDAAVLVASHDLEFATCFCRRFTAIEGERIVHDGEDVSAVRRKWGMEETETKY